MFKLPNSLRTALPFLLVAVTGFGAESPSSIPVAHLANLPLAFVKQGTGYKALGQSYMVSVDSGNAAIRLLSPAIGNDAAGTTHLTSIEFAGGQRTTAVADRELSGKVNYINGNDPRKWQIGLPTVGRLTCPEVYRGIDVIYYGNQHQLEFDLVVKPGADPRSIRMKIGGGGKLSLDSTGGLEIGGPDGLRIDLPAIYQETNGARKAIAGHFSIRGRDEVAFAVDHWDHSKRLVIDPTIVYSTLLGGGLGSGSASAIALDSSRNILIAGSTSASDFPTVNATQSTYSGSEGFISKIDPSGTSLVYSTYFGGSNTAFSAIATDSTGAAWATGVSSFSNFPLLHAVQSSGNAAVVKLDAAGVLQFSTYLGGPSDRGNGIAVDSAGNAYIAGNTYGAFLLATGSPKTTSAAADAFLAKFSPTGSLVYATVLGGTGQDNGNAIAVDSNGDAYLTGSTTSAVFAGAPAGGAQGGNNGNGDAFVAKVKSDGSALLYFTFLGGSSSDQGTAIGVDSALNAYVAGQTSSAGLATAGAAQTALAGATDGFLAKLNPAGNSFGYITYLGGRRQDYLRALAADAVGNVYVTGSTESTDFPTTSAVQPTIAASTTTLFSTNDAGVSWSAADSSIPGAVFDVSLNPTGTSGVTITESGIYRTVNGGATWARQLSLEGINSAEFSRSLAAPGTIYAVANCCGPAGQSTVYQSTDDGVTWSAKFSSSTTPRDIIADPLSANTVYLLNTSSLSKSTDGGVSWIGITPSLGQLSAMIGAPDGALYATIQATNRGADVYKSTNQGASWTALGAGLPFIVNFPAHPLSASGTAIYLAAYTVYQTTNGGGKWISSTGSVGVSQLVVSSQNPLVQYALTSTGTVQASSDGGVTWNPQGTGLTGSGSKLIVDAVNGAHVLLLRSASTAAFVAKVNSVGSSLTWSTFLGGTGNTAGNAIATDGSGNAWVTGSATGPGFPTTSSVISNFGTIAFVTKVSDATANCAQVVNPSAQTITGVAQTLYVSLVAPSGCAWNLATNATWATIASAASGAGSGVISVQVAANTGTATRTVTLTVGNQTASITQAGNSCSYSLDTPPGAFSADPPAYTVPAGGGTVSALLTATAGCPWSVLNPYPSAVAVTSGSSGTGSGAIQLTVSPIPGLTFGTRNFYLSVGTATIQIEQVYQSPQSQGISFAAIAAQTLDFAPPPLSATASSGFAVTFSSNTPAVCTVSGTTVTLVGVGTCSITANQSGTVVWLAAPPVKQTFAVTQGPALPQPTGGIANAASAGQATPSVVGIGSYVAIYGFALADNGSSSATTLPLPTSLNGTQVTLGGLPMPLLYAGSGQLNAIVPMGLTPGQSYPLIVTRDTIPSAPVSLSVLELQPGIYTTSTSGSGAGIVTNALTGALINQANPAGAGDFLTIYCTGLGPVHGPNGEAGPPDGAAAPTNLVYSTTATVTANLGGSSTQVVFSGLTATFAGLYQVNVQVPAGLVAGNQALSLTLTATDPKTGATGRSNSVTVFIK